MTNTGTERIFGSRMSADAGVSPDELQEIAIEAYVFAYPLVLMELTRRAMTNVPRPLPSGHAPMNRFCHMTTFPDPGMSDVVRPNVDTLYSHVWYDVTHEPLVIGVPDSGGRYYLLEMMDMWTDVFDAPGSRTTGTGSYAFAVVGPDWEGRIPKGVDPIRSPTSMGWIIGRTQTNGPQDFLRVHAFQAGIKAVPLGLLGEAHAPKDAEVNAAWLGGAAPVDEIDRMDPGAYFALFSELLKSNPPHGNDHSMLQRLRRLGLEVGESFSMEAASSAVGRAITKAWPLARRAIQNAISKSGVLTNGWRVNLTAIGSYGTDYLHRAAVAYSGLGANPPDDAVYPFAFADEKGEPFRSDRRYLLHFTKEQLPPVRAFWSLTLYDDRQLLAENPIDRYALGDRDPMQFNVDGSLDIYIQRDPPGINLESNWLPAPKAGGFTMNLRLYWPKPEVISGDWTPPPVRSIH
jgi:hypothetical protein